MEPDCQDAEQCVTLCFDGGEEITLNKTYLVDHSLYFEAMFNGSFMETRLNNRIPIQGICYKTFLSVIENSKNNYIILDCLEDVLLLFETAQILQFTDLIQSCIKLFGEKWLLTIHALPIFSLANNLGLKDLSNKARICILYNFKTFLVDGRDSFLKLTEEDLQILLSDSGLNVDNERDVFDLIMDWCSENKNHDVEYKLAVGCVGFNLMNTDQLQYCLSRINDFKLEKTIKQYIKYKKNKKKSIVPFIKPARSVPSVFCAVSAEKDGSLFVYRWDWNLMKFIKFFKVDPLPHDTNGTHIIVKGLDIFVLVGEIGHGEEPWIEGGWKYNMVLKEWKKLNNVILTEGRHGLVCFCKEDFYLIGDSPVLHEENIFLDRFNLHEGEFIEKNRYSGPFTPELYMFGHMFFFFEHNGQLALISSSENRPKLFILDLDEGKSEWVVSKLYTMNIRLKLVAAVSYRNYIYCIGHKYCSCTLGLYRYSVMNDSIKLLHEFRAILVRDSTMCAFDINNAMVFGGGSLERYCLDTNKCNYYSVKLDSFHSKTFLSIPFY